jgi:CheY-like chemotaxis protein
MHRALPSAQGAAAVKKPTVALIPPTGSQSGAGPVLPRPSRAVPEDRGAPATSPASARLLVVEDDYLVGLEIERALLDAGYDVIGVAATAEEAVELAQGTRPELVIMDVRLAGVRDGVDAALELYEQLGIRSIFATAHHDANTRLRAQPARPFGWLRKPFRQDALVAAVREALNELRSD